MRGHALDIVAVRQRDDTGLRAGHRLQQLYDGVGRGPHANAPAVGQQRGELWVQDVDWRKCKTARCERMLGFKPAFRNREAQRLK